MLLIAYMCPYSLDINISSSFFLHFWQGDSRKSQDLAWAASSVPIKPDQAATNSEFSWMQGPVTECGLSIGFDAFPQSCDPNRVLLFRVSLCLCPIPQNSGISNTFVLAPDCECHEAPGKCCYLTLLDGCSLRVRSHWTFVYPFWRHYIAVRFR